MITGFNTDVEYGGVTYHVQTEDKGLDTPLILSLVYVGGAILASKRTSYHDLIAKGFVEEELTERLNRQHKLICAAVRAGRIDELKKMAGAGDGSSTHPRQSAKKVTEPPTQPATTQAPKGTPQPGEQIASVATPPVRLEPDILEITTLSDPALYEEYRPAEVSGAPFTPASDVGASAVVTPDHEPPLSVTAAGATVETEPPVAASGGAATSFYIRLLDDEGDFRAGELVTIRIHVGRELYGSLPVAGAEVTVKVLGTTFRPLIVATETDERGLAVVRALLPRFTSGRAAILIRARAEGHEAELRRIIKQA